MSATVIPILFHIIPSTIENLEMTTVFMLVSLVRSYVCRRFFNWLNRGDAQRCPTNQQSYPTQTQRS